MEFEYIREKVKPDRKSRNAIKVVIEDWIQSENKTLKFKCKDPKELRSVSNCAYHTKRAKNYDYTIFKRLSLCEVYLVKA
jgi:hypothetical protein